MLETTILGLAITWLMLHPFASEMDRAWRELRKRRGGG